MAVNNLAVLIPTLISTIQETARNTGFLVNLTTRDQRMDAAAKGQSITFPVLPDIVATDVTAGNTSPDATGVTATAATMTLSNQKAGQFKLFAEDEKAMADLGLNYRNEQINLAVAAVIDAYVSDLATVMDQGAGLALGTVGTAAFASTPNILADIQQSLADDKAPDNSRIAALSTIEYANASKLSQFQKLSEAPLGTDFAAGRLGMLSNFNVGYDQFAGRIHTTTAAGGWTVNNGPGYAAGVASIALTGGTGTFAAGDIVTIAGNFLPNTTTLANMIVKSWDGTTLVLTRGLLSAVANSASVVRLASHYSSFAGHRSAVYTSFRPSAEVTGGDAAKFSQIVRDPVTGLALRLAYYPQYHQGLWEVSGVFGSIVRRPTWLRKVIR